MSKLKRQSLILDAIKKIGLAEVHRIINSIYPNGLDTEKLKLSFRRLIERDLQEMSDNHLLVKRFFSKDIEDAEILSDDLELTKEGDIKNIYRVKYCLTSSKQNIPGINSLEETNLRFIKYGNLVSWQATNLESGCQKGLLHVVCEKRFGSFVALTVASSDTPFQLLFARNGQRNDYIPTSEDIEKKYGAQKLSKRTAILLSSDKSVSRPIKDKRLGHAAIRFFDNGNRIEITDLESTTKTFYCHAERSALHEIEKFSSKNRTIRPNERIPYCDIFQGKSDWLPLDTQPMSLDLPIFVMLGSQVFLISL